MDTKSLKSTLDQIEKDLGLKVQKLSDAPPLDIETIRSGSFLLDDALGVPGYPRGRIIEVFGAPSGGKTSLALAAVAEAQRGVGVAAFIDVEHAFSKQYARDLGVDVDNLYFVQPDYGEQALETLERLIASNAFDIIVLDSTAALVPKAELDEDMEKQSMGLQARLLSKACRKITPIIGKTKTVVIFINQIRQSMSMYGSPTTTPGGEALKFYSSVRLSVRKVSGSELKEGSNILGHKMAINVVKNKVAPPMKTAELTFLYGKGIDRVTDLIEYALDKGFLEHKGHTYIFEDQKWVGRENAAEGIRNNPEIYKAIAQKVMDTQGTKATASN